MSAQTAELQPTVRVLPLERATPAALAPFGRVLGYDSEVAPMPIDFYDGTVKVRRVVDFVSDEQTEMPVVTVDRRPLEVRWMERHFKHTQAFIPLGGAPFIAVFAPPTDTSVPNVEAVRAFYFDGSSGFAMHIGVWHEFPFAVRDGTHLIVVLRREATDGLVRDNVVQGEASSPDLEKRDLLARCNTLFRIQE